MVDRWKIDNNAEVIVCGDKSVIFFKQQKKTKNTDHDKSFGKPQSKC